MEPCFSHARKAGRGLRRCRDDVAETTLPVPSKLALRWCGLGSAAHATTLCSLGSDVPYSGRGYASLVHIDYCQTAQRITRARVEDPSDAWCAPLSTSLGSGTMTMPALELRHAAGSGIRRGGGPYSRSVPGADDQPIRPLQQRQRLPRGEPRADGNGNPELQGRIAFRHAETTADRLPRAGSTSGQSRGVPPAFPRGADATAPRGRSRMFIR